MLDVGAVLGGEEAFDVWVCVGEADQGELGGDDLAADAGDYSVEAGEGFGEVGGEEDVADNDFDLLGPEGVDEGGFGEEGVGGSLGESLG